MSSSNIRIVLVNTTHPGNIGGVARAMKNMDLTALHLVAPVEFITPEAQARASGAEDILAGATVWETLEQALAGCALVVGTSGRGRRIPWPMLEAPAAARRLLVEANEAPVALVFGRERTGLTNQELDLCHFLVGIPTNPAFPSLNLAAAVQILAYEIMLARREAQTVPARTEGRLASHEELQLFYRHLEEVLVEIGFLDPQNPRKLMRRMARLFNRAGLDENEVNILRGILTAVQRRQSPNT